MITPRVTETRRLSPYAFMYEGTPTIPIGETVSEYRRRTKPRKRRSVKTAR